LRCKSIIFHSALITIHIINKKYLITSIFFTTFLFASIFATISIQVFDTKSTELLIYLSFRLLIQCIKETDLRSICLNLIFYILILSKYLTENLKYRRILEMFSLEHNLKKLLSSKTDNEISCIHGIRVITITWVIFGHSIDWTYWGIYSNVDRFDKIITHILNSLFREYIWNEKSVE